MHSTIDKVHKKSLYELKLFPYSGTISLRLLWLSMHSVLFEFGDGIVDVQTLYVDNMLTGCMTYVRLISQNPLFDLIKDVLEFIHLFGTTSAIRACLLCNI